MINSKLMPIPDINDVFTDGFIVDDTGTLAFLSIIGKDTAIQEFRARWSLPVTQGGLTDFQVDTGDTSVRLNIGNPETLEFLSGRLSTRLFGELVQVFVFKHLAQKPDMVNRKALQLYQGDDIYPEKLWTLIKGLSPLPLLDEWQDMIISMFKEKGWLIKQPGITISGMAINIDEVELAGLLKANIQSGALRAIPGEDGCFVDPSKATLSPVPDKLKPKHTVSSIDGHGTLDEIFGEPISVYSRSQAINDGYLIDVTDSSETREAGFTVPVALTREVWESYVAWPESKGGQDEKGRLWDVLYMAVDAIRRSTLDEGVLTYQLFCVPPDSTTGKAKEVTLKMVSGPGDNSEHVITIMKPNES